MTTLIGIDPGLQRTGWGVIRSAGSQLSFIAAGVITTDPKAPMSARLHTLHTALHAVLAQHSPTDAAIEETFVNKNSASSLKLGQARGALMLSLALSGLPVAEYSANLVKKSVVGVGHADKNQIAMMVGTLLPPARGLKLDAADALAVAICHAHHKRC